MVTWKGNNNQHRQILGRECGQMTLIKGGGDSPNGGPMWKEVCNLYMNGYTYILYVCKGRGCIKYMCMSEVSEKWMELEEWSEWKWKKCEWDEDEKLKTAKNGKKHQSEKQGRWKVEVSKFLLIKDGSRNPWTCKLIQGVGRKLYVCELAKGGSHHSHTRSSFGQALITAAGVSEVNNYIWTSLVQIYYLTFLCLSLLTI